MDDYYSRLDRIREAGLTYGTACIKYGDTEPDPAPFSGEWADGLTGQDALDQAGIEATFSELDQFEQDDVLSYWEEGYCAAPWPDGGEGA